MTTLPKYLTQDELKRFFAVIDSPRDRALFGLIYHYGLRVGEALLLTVDDVNFQNHRITIRSLLSFAQIMERCYRMGYETVWIPQDIGTTAMPGGGPAATGLELARSGAPRAGIRELRGARAAGVD
jgi:integrase-like protein